MPPFRAGNEKAPWLLLVVSSVSPVALLFTVTMAPGTTPPPASTTTPDKVDVVVPCAYPREASANAAHTNTANRNR